MADYFERRGPWGRVMMRHTASLQINLDFGPDGVWPQRWLLANLMAPLVAATFAASPGPEGPGERALAWQLLGMAAQRGGDYRRWCRRRTRLRDDAQRPAKRGQEHRHREQPDVGLHAALFT